MNENGPAGEPEDGDTERIVGTGEKLAAAVEQLIERTEIADQVERRVGDAERRVGEQESFGRRNRALIVLCGILLIPDVILSIVAVGSIIGLVNTSHRVDSNTGRVQLSSCVVFGLVHSGGYNPRDRTGQDLADYRQFYFTIEHEYQSLDCERVLGVPGARTGREDMKTPTTIILDAEVWAFIGGVIVPFLVAILAKNTAARATKSVLNASLSVVVGVLSVLAENAGHALTAKMFVITIGTAAITSFSTYVGFSKPTGIAPALHNATGSFGIGTSTRAA